MLISGAVLLALELLPSSVEFDLEGGMGLIMRPPLDGSPSDEHSVEEDSACVRLASDVTRGVGGAGEGAAEAPNCAVLLLCLRWLLTK